MKIKYIKLVLPIVDNLLRTNLKLVVAAGLRPAVEPGILPGGTGERRHELAKSTSDKSSGRRDAHPLRQARRPPLPGSWKARSVVKSRLETMNRSAVFALSSSGGEGRGEEALPHAGSWIANPNHSALDTQTPEEARHYESLPSQSCVFASSRLCVYILLFLSFLATTLPLAADPIAPDTSPQNFSHDLPYELGDSQFVPGDSITIQGLRGTTDAVQPGGTYCVTGTYTLNSQDEADLSFFATTTNRAATPIDPAQTMRVKRGTGSFRLVKKMTDPGYLHLTFYSRTNGQGFGGVYFGQGQWVLRDKQFRYPAAASTQQEARLEQPSASGPNQVLFAYLGGPVTPPSDMDPAYSRDGLTRAMQTAAGNAGISLVKLEIDDSEFPFLVGLVFAKEGDKEKLKEQIGKLPAYALSGSVGGDTSYVMNLVPHRAFPPESSLRIYRRMMLREAVLYDKITSTP